MITKSESDTTCSSSKRFIALLCTMNKSDADAICSSLDYIILESLLLITYFKIDADAACSSLKKYHRWRSSTTPTVCSTRLQSTDSDDSIAR